MVYADLPFAIPGPLGVDYSAVSDNRYPDDGSGYDFAIDGVPYVSAASKDYVLLRQTNASFRLLQDSNNEPGEQTLADWWVKAQSTFHLGAGQKFLDSNDEVAAKRFLSSTGVNVWTPGQVTLLNDVNSSPAGSTASIFCVTTDGGLNIMFVAEGTVLRWYKETVTVSGVNNSAISWTSGTCNTTSTTAILGVCTDGASVYFTDALGVYKIGVAAPSVASVKIYVLPTAVQGMVGWVKQRLMLAMTDATNGARVFELDSNAAAASALPTVKFTHQNKSWLWTGITDGPAAIYMSGYANAISAIYKFVLDTQGIVPVLTTGITTFESPIGEVILGIRSYLGSVMGIVSSRGVRVAAFNNSDLSVGRLTISQTNTAGACAGSDRFLYTALIGTDGVARLGRVDPTAQVDNGVFAYASDLSTGAAGVVKQVEPWGNRIAFLVTGVGIVVQEPTKLVSSGSLITSRVRFGTLEPKRARVLRIRLDTGFTHGQVSASIGVDSDSLFSNVLGIDQNISSDSGESPVYVNDAGFYCVSFTLNRDAASLPAHYSPCLSGYQLKVLPAAFVPTRTTLPLLCEDEEETRTGSAQYRPALLRLQTLEGLMKSGRVVRFQALAPNPAHAFSELVVVEQIQYRQVTAPDDDTAFGGTLVVILRSVS